MNYELAKKLKDAGFPQNKASKRCDRNIRSWFIDDSAFCENGGYLERGGVKRAYVPSLSELIEAYGDSFFGLGKELVGVYWSAWAKNADVDEQFAMRPEEAVAKLWLALNKK